MVSNPNLEFIFFPTNSATVGDLSASYGEIGISTKKDFPITDEKSQDELLAAICAEYPGIILADAKSKIRKLAANAIRNAEKNREQPKQADLIVKLAESAEFFTDGDAEYATVLVNSHFETYKINERGFKDWISHQYYKKYGRGVNSQSMQDAVDQLRAKAKFDGQKKSVFLRIGELDGNIYLDLCNSNWEVVEITRGGWSIVSKSPICFVRKRGMQEIPSPVRGGSIEELRPLINAADDETWQLLVFWLIGALRPRGPYPILAINGEQGSAKSTLCRMLRRLIDPNKSDLRALSREERDLIITAGNSWIVGFDNLSTIRAEMSDALCRLSTGGGFSTRQLTTDDSEMLFEACRPQILNGIEEVVSKPDLLERSIPIHLRTIPDHMRKTEAELWDEFKNRHPRILGALLDVMAVALREHPNVKLERKPRLADFATLATAAEAGLGWPRGTFMAAYQRNAESANAAALEDSPVAQAIVELIESDGPFRGTMSGLIAKLQERQQGDEKARDRMGWPNTPRKMSGELARVTPVLRKAGFEVIKGEREGRDRKRIIRIERAGETPSAPSAIVQSGDSGPQADVSPDDEIISALSDSPPKRPHSDAENAEKDATDGVDGMALAQSAYAGGF